MEASEAEAAGLHAWQVGYVEVDKDSENISILHGSCALIHLVTIDPDVFLRSAPNRAKTIAAFILNTHGKGKGQAMAVPLDGLETQDVKRAQEILGKKYPNCKIGIQKSQYDVRQRVRESMQS